MNTKIQKISSKRKRVQIEIRAEEAIQQFPIAIKPGSPLASKMLRLVKWFCTLIWYRSSLPKGFCRKGVLRNFAKFTGKHLCQSLFFNKVAGLRLSKNTFFHRKPLVAASAEYFTDNEEGWIKRIREIKWQLFFIR